MPKVGPPPSPHHLDVRAFSMFTPQEPDQVSEEIAQVPAHALYTFRLGAREDFEILTSPYVQNNTDLFDIIFPHSLT